MLEDDFFVGNATIPKEVKINGNVYIVHFKELPMIGFSIYKETLDSETDEVRHGAIAKLISMSVFNADGTPMMSYEKACTLKRDPANAMMKHILEINGFGGEAKKG